MVANLVVVSTAGATPGVLLYNNLGTVNLVVDLEGVYTTTPSPDAAARVAPELILKRTR